MRNKAIRYIISLPLLLVAVAILANNALLAQSPCAEGKPCYCGCGGTPRPYCAYKCWSSKQGPAEREQGVIPPEGARVVMTGAVVAGEPATVSVINPQGQTLSGVVVEVANQRIKTDESGRAIFTVPQGASLSGAVIAEEKGSKKKLIAAIAGLSGAASAVVLTRDGNGAVKAPPQIKSLPHFVQPGQVTIGGEHFSGDAAGNVVNLGDRTVPVLASSPVELVAALPSDLPLGRQPLTVTTAAGTSEPAYTEAVQLRLEANKTTLRRGQSATLRLIVKGTEKPVDLKVANLTPQNIRLEKGSVAIVRTSGGRYNSSSLKVTGIDPGIFQIAADILPLASQDELPKGWTEEWKKYGDKKVRRVKDEKGRTRRETKYNPDGSMEDSTWDYDEQGRVTRRRTYKWNSDGSGTKETVEFDYQNGKGQRTTTQLDENGNTKGQPKKEQFDLP